MVFVSHGLLPRRYVFYDEPQKFPAVEIWE